MLFGIEFRNCMFLREWNVLFASWLMIDFSQFIIREGWRWGVLCITIVVILSKLVCMCLRALSFCYANLVDFVPSDIRNNFFHGKSKVWIQYNFNYNLGGLNGFQWIDYWVIVCHICGAIENCMMTLSINHVTHISLLCSLWLIKDLHSQPITTNY